MRACFLLLLSFSLVACSPAVVRCGPGTTLVLDQCLALPDDAGSMLGGHDGGTTLESRDAGASPDAGAVELPTTAIIDPIDVVEGFATCPTVTVGFASGQSVRLILDPTYVVPVARTLRIDHAGFSLVWTSAGGDVRADDLPTCRGAVVGVKSGRSMVSLSVDDGRGTRRMVGTAMVNVHALPPTAAIDSARVRGPSTFPAIGEVGGLAVGEERPLEVSFTVPVSGPGQVLAVPGAFQLTSSDPATLTVNGMNVRGVRAGNASVLISYVAQGRVLAPLRQTITVIGSQPPADVVFGLPLADDGRVLPEEARLLDRLSIGTCFSTRVWGFQQQGQATALRNLDAQATVTVLGSGLTQTEPGGLRFCATSLGDGAIRACTPGRCWLFGYVVTEARASPSIVLTMPRLLKTGAFGRQTVCLDLRVTAVFSDAERRDVTSSAALRFREPFSTPGASRLTVLLDEATGLPQQQQGRTCFEAEVNPGLPDHGVRVFYAGGQAEAQITLER